MGVALGKAMLPQRDQLGSPLQTLEGAGTIDAGVPTPPIERLLAELLAAIRRQTALLERAYRDHRESPPALLSKREAARLLGVSRGRTLDSLLASGQVRAVRIGGRLRVPVAEIERLQAEVSGWTAESSPRGGRPTQSASAMNKALRRRGF
jgi:excisionase family DNA binding protein